jgi:predicted HTH domain antitoxin
MPPDEQERQTIDEQLAAMADDPEYLALNEAIAKEFEESDWEAFQLAVELYEKGQVSTGTAAQLAGMERVDFIFALDHFGLSPIGVDPDELEDDMTNA